MKKRYIAGLALALMGILSGCGQAKTQPADNTISITPVEQKTNGSQIDKSVKYEFSGNHADANGIEIQRYEWDGSAWNKDDYGLFTVNSGKSGKAAERFGSSRKAMLSIRNISLWYSRMTSEALYRMRTRPS